MKLKIRELYPDVLPGDTEFEINTILNAGNSTKRAKTVFGSAIQITAMETKTIIPMKVLQSKRKSTRPVCT